VTKDSGEIMSVRKSRGASRRRIRVTIPKWESAFDAAVADNVEATLVLSNWGFFGLPEGFVRAALWFYFCAPSKHESATALEAKMGLRPLCRRMVAVANDLEKVLDLYGVQLSAALDELDKALPPKLRAVNGQKISEQPKLLRVCAAVFYIFSGAVGRTPGGQKLVASRALVWLFLAAREFTGQSNHKTYDQIATLLDAANEATGRTERFSSAEEIRARISRFKKAFPDEVAWIRSHLRNDGIPQKATDFAALVTFGSTFWRLSRQ
jgi:hypothetical protein